MLKQTGFTLIEMAISIIILGLLISMFAPSYAIYLRNQNLTETRKTISDVEDAISVFRERHGRYPLPASLTAERGDDDYGYESDWDGDDTVHANAFEGQTNDFTQNPDFDLATHPVYGINACTNGICVRPGDRTVDHDRDAGAATAEVTPRVRIGTVPFRMLNLEEDSMYDAYNNRITYAVVERLARTTTYDDAQGVISLEDADGNSLIENESSAHFIVFSHGENSAGAYTRAGSQIDCTLGTGDIANTTCNIASGNAVFTIDQTSNVAGAQGFDDVAAMFVNKPVPGWKFSENDPDDIFTDNYGGVGIGTDTPQEKLDVAGKVLIVDGDAMSNELCDDVYTDKCFETSLIAGASTSDNTCPSGQYMVGIKNSQVICQASITVGCPDNQIMTGITGGAPVCEAVPDCAATSLPVCNGNNMTITGADAGDTEVLQDGPAEFHYTCNGSNWVLTTQTGTCPSTDCVVGGGAATSTFGYVGEPMYASCADLSTPIDCSNPVTFPCYDEGDTNGDGDPRVYTSCRCGQY